MTSGEAAFVDLNVQLLALEKRQCYKRIPLDRDGGLYLLRDKAFGRGN